MKKNKAITLIELLVSIGILIVTISLAAAFIKFQKPNIELYQGARELRAALGEARERALTDQHHYKIHFTVPANQYELKAVDSGATLQTYTLPGSVQYYTVGPFLNDSIIFNPTGGAEQTGAIVLQNSAGARKNIIISPAGYVKIE